MPKNVPKVNWVVEKTENGKNGDFDIVTKTLSGDDNSSDPHIELKIGLILVTPANAKGPVPVMLLFSGAGFGFPVTPPIPGAAPALAGPPYRPNGFAVARGGFGGRGPVIAGRGAGRGPQGPAPQQQILARGWGYALLNTGARVGRLRGRLADRGDRRQLVIAADVDAYLLADLEAARVRDWQTSGAGGGS